MSNLDYSIEALNVMHMFHNSDFVVYVEGDDDVHFWKNVLDIAEIRGYYIESVGGVEEINKKVKLLNGTPAKTIIARDRDHSCFCDDYQPNPCIVTTYGYSIENTLYCPKKVNRLISKHSRALYDMSEYLCRWYDDFCESSYDLLIYDVASRKYHKGISVFGENCCQLLTNEKSTVLSKEKIAAKLIEIECYFTAEEIATCKDMIDTDSRHNRYLLKGHFLTNAIVNLIKHAVTYITNRKVKITPDNIYIALIDACLSCRERCIDMITTIATLQAAHNQVCNMES